MDFHADEPRDFDWRWRLLNDNDAARHFASLAFVNMARTADGQVHRADYDTIACVADLLALAVTMADLDPTSGN